MSNWFENYRSRLDKRADSFNKIFLFLEEQNTPYCTHYIVETGTARIEDNFSGDGLSTLLFSRFCQYQNYKLFSVDINKDHIEISKKITKDYLKNVEYHCGDSIEFLENFKLPITLLYLDSYDCDPTGDTEAAQLHQLSEIKAAYKNLSTQSIVLLDDNDFENGGKTKLSKEFLIAKGWECIHNEKQAIFTIAKKVQ